MQLGAGTTALSNNRVHIDTSLYCSKLSLVHFSIYGNNNSSWSVSDRMCVCALFESHPVMRFTPSTDRLHWWPVQFTSLSLSLSLWLDCMSQHRDWQHSFILHLHACQCTQTKPNKRACSFTRLDTAPGTAQANRAL